MKKYTLLILLIVFSSFVYADEANDCGNNEQAQLLARLIINDKEQKRTNINCNRILTEAAESKARKMSEIGFVIHHLGGGPNLFLIEAGYKLPKYYGTGFNSNQVEAIAGGASDADEVWNGFKRSKGHRTHLLGEHEFYIEQDEIGVGFIKKWESPHVEYWVVYLTKGFERDQSSPIKSDIIPNKGLQHSKDAKIDN